MRSAPRSLVRSPRANRLAFASVIASACLLNWSSACIQEYSLADAAETGQDMCGEGLTVCDGGCVNLTTDNHNCGGCGIDCGEDGVCEANTCVPACIPGCDDVMELCVAGQCECRFGFDRCGDECANYETDWSDCGGCDNPCAKGLFCNGGECLPDCGDLDACELDCVDTESNPLHCGDCEDPCELWQVCLGGECFDALEPEVYPCDACPCANGCLEEGLTQCCFDEFLDVPVCVEEEAC